MVASDNDSTNNNSITCASSILAATSNYKITIMTINKIKQLYNKYDFLIDCDKYVQARIVYREIQKLEQLEQDLKHITKINSN